MHRLILAVVLAATLGACNSGGGSSNGSGEKPANHHSTTAPATLRQAQGRFVAMQKHRFDPISAWPLCGRISESAPAGWTADQGCPADRWGSADHTDLPLVGNFGPRLKATENYRYDFHRGIDIRTAAGTPVFAITDGQVMIAGHHPMYQDLLVQLRHDRPGASHCNGGCYYSNYSHLSAWVVNAGETVSKGQLIGFSGANEAGYEHLHFALREVPDNSQSPWQRYAIHPLNMLPYDNCSPSELAVKITQWNTDNPLQPQLRLRLSQPAADPRLQIREVEIEILERNEQGLYQRISQPGDSPNAEGYYEHPSWLNFDTWNQQYTHMDSAQTPWDSFVDCPYAAEHGPDYAPNVHLDQTHPIATQQGNFNGIRLAPQAYEGGSSHYVLDIGFQELQGGLDAESLCVIAHVRLFDGRLRQTSRGCNWQTASQVCNAACREQREQLQAQRCS